jgi:hypothetical protein
MLIIASDLFFPQTKSSAWKELQILGRSGFPNNWQRLSCPKCRHLTPAGLPSNIPGIIDEIEISVQQAPHL